MLIAPLHQTNRPPLTPPTLLSQAVVEDFRSEGTEAKVKLIRSEATDLTVDLALNGFASPWYAKLAQEEGDQYANCVPQ